MAFSTHDGDHQFLGAVTPKTINLPANSVSDVNILANPASGLGVSPLKSRQQRIDLYFNPLATPSSTAAPVTDRRTLRVMIGVAAVLNSYKATLVGALITGNATITIDLLKNGTTVLSAVITLNSAAPASVRTLVAGAFTVTTAAAGDVLEANVVATIGTGTLGQGLVVELVTTEDPA